MYRFTAKENIHVSKLKIMACIKIFTTNITTTGYGDSSIRNDEFIVHTMINMIESKNVINHAKITIFIGIK